MLDDMNVIAQRDGSDALGLAAATPDQLVHDFGIKDVQLSADIQNVVYSGMGGSSLQAELARTFPALHVPFVISKDYNIPAFVNEHTLFFASSYSGNTEETLASLVRAREAGAQIIIVAGGGKLLEEAQAHEDTYVVLPKAVQPRMAVFYGYRVLLELLVAAKLCDASVLETVAQAVDGLKNAITQWTADQPTATNPAKQLALQLVGKTPIVYAGPLMAPAAYKWKISFNESGKNTSWMGILSEYDHNEFIGWSSHPIEKPFAVVDLISDKEHPRILERFEIGDRLLSGMRPKAIRVEAKGETTIEQLLYLVLFGDFVSLYLGILNGVDPSPVELVERLKKELG